MYEKIELHESLVIMLSNGITLEGEVVGKDSDWIAICTPDSNEPWCIAHNAIAAFRVHI